MNFVLQPWQLLLAILAGWINRQQQEVIEYLRTENQILKEMLGNRLIDAGAEVRRRAGAVHCRERLGGILRYYYRPAA
jgi:putative transposase